MDPVQHAVAGGQRQGHAQAVAEQQRGRGELLAQALEGVLQAARRAVEQGAVLFVGDGVRVARPGQLAVQRGEVGGQGAERAQQALPGRVALLAQVFERGLEVFQGQLAVGVVERLAQADSPRQGLAGLALLVEQALAAEQHVAVEERLGQPVVRVVRGTGALVDVLGDEIELQVAAHLGARPAMAETVENGLLGLVQRHHHLAVLPCQGEALALHVELAQRFEQARLDPQVFAQLEIQAGKTLLHRLVGEQRVPQYREQPVPGRPGHQQQRFVPDIGDLAAALVHADHGVDREDQGRRGDRRIALAEGAEEDHAERRQRHPGNEQPGIGEQQLDGEGGDAEAQQGHQQRLQAAEPVVVGLRQGAGDDPEEQRDQQLDAVLPPAQQQGAGQGDEYPQAIGELVEGPEAAERVCQRRGRHGGGVLSDGPWFSLCGLSG